MDLGKIVWSIKKYRGGMSDKHCENVCKTRLPHLYARKIHHYEMIIEIVHFLNENYIISDHFTVSTEYQIKVKYAFCTGGFHREGWFWIALRWYSGMTF